MSRKRRRTASTPSGQVRIIGGDWRRRTLGFPAVDDVRPTPDRVRETLFNWLADEVPGARCLDLFAGSGALGLEALSRGAQSVVFVDSSRSLTRALKANLGTLGASNAEIRTMDVLAFLKGEVPQQTFEMVFLDPPFRQGWIEPLCTMLSVGAWVGPGSWIYLEHEKELDNPPVPAQWHLSRRKTAGQVAYSLFEVQEAGRSA